MQYSKKWVESPWIKEKMEVPTVCSQDNGTHNFFISFKEKDKWQKVLFLGLCNSSSIKSWEGWTCLEVLLHNCNYSCCLVVVHSSSGEYQKRIPGICFWLTKSRVSAALSRMTRNSKRGLFSLRKFSVLLSVTSWSIWAQLDVGIAFEEVTNTSNFRKRQPVIR